MPTREGVQRYKKDKQKEIQKFVLEENQKKIERGEMVLNKDGTINFEKSQL